MYSLGATLWELLALRPLFGATDATPTPELMQKIQIEEPTRLRRLNPAVPRDLAAVVEKCLQKDARNRYATAQELAEELASFLAGKPVKARAVTGPERMWKWARRRPAQAALLGMIVLTLVGLVVGGGVFAWQAEQGRRKEEGLRKKADQKAEELRQTLAHSSVSLANREYEAGNVVHARELLDEIPRDLRRWEWGYLRRTIRGSYSTLYGHTGPVSGVSFSPDGGRLASGSHDGTVKVWDAVTGTEVLTLKGYTGRVSSVAFSPDGGRLASGSHDATTVEVWDAATGRPVLTLRGHRGGVTSVTFSPDGKRLASGSHDGTVKVWDTATDLEALTLKGHTKLVTGVSFSPDSRRLASGSADNTVRVWDAATGQVILTLTGHIGRINSVSFSPDGRRLASGGEDNTVKVWDTHTGQELLTLKGYTNNAVNSVAFSPDGGRLASGSHDGTVKVWDTATRQVILALTLPTGQFSGLALSPDGKTLWTRDDVGLVRCWNVHTGMQLDSSSPPPPFAGSGARHPSAPLLALPEGDTILLIDVSPPDAEEVAFRRAKAGFDPFWHEEQAAEAEKTNDGFAAAFHLGQLLSSRPWDPDLHVRRAYALARLGQTAPAARHYLQAILLNPRVRLWPLDPQAAARGTAAAQAGDWPRAVEAFRLAAHQPGAAPAIWEGLLLALRASRQDAACPQVIHAMLDHFADRRDVLTTRILLFYSLVAVCDEADARRLIQVATRLVAGQRNATHLVWLGAAFYRANRYEDAVKALQESIKMQGKGGYADSWLFLAMAHQRLGHAGQARQWFAKSESWFRAQHFGTWQHRLRWQLLQGEANALVNPPPRMPHASDGD